MAKEIYMLLTKGDDGKFMFDTYESLDRAKETLETFVTAQKDMETDFGSQVYVDYHKYERLRLPEFIINDNDILVHVTVNSGYGQYKRSTDRYIIKSNII